MTFTINWKTTLAGVTAILLAAGHILQLVTAGDLNWAAYITDVQSLIVGVGLIFAKDANVTGGTVAATPEATVRLAPPLSPKS